MVIIVGQFTVSRLRMPLILTVCATLPEPYGSGARSTIAEVTKSLQSYDMGTGCEAGGDV